MNISSTNTQTVAQLHADRDLAVIRCSIDIAATPSTVYAVWSDVSHWHLWDPETRWARLDGPFVAGSSGRIAPQKGFPAKMHLVEATKDQSFTVVCPVLGSQMQFEHRIQALGANLLVTHEVRFSGWLSGFLMRIVGSGLIRSLPNAMQGLKATCEEGKLGSDSN